MDKLFPFPVPVFDPRRRATARLHDLFDLGSCAVCCRDVSHATALLALYTVDVHSMCSLYITLYITMCMNMNMNMNACMQRLLPLRQLYSNFRLKNGESLRIVT